jgi:hypothetical protein
MQAIQIIILTTYNFFKKYLGIHQTFWLSLPWAGWFFFSRLIIMGRIMQDVGSNYVTFNSNCRIAKATGVYNKEAPS